jgi:hypothetical protein
MEANKIWEPKWIAIGLTALVLVGGAWKIISSLSEGTEVRKSPSQTAKAIPVPKDGSYLVFDTSWGQGQDLNNETSSETSNSEVDPTDPNHMPYILSEEERAFALKAAKTWQGLPIAIEGRN